MDDNIITQSEIDNVEINKAMTCDISELCKMTNSPNKSLTIISQNIRSIYKNFNELEISLASFSLEIDIIVLTECCLNNDKPIPSMTSYTSYKTTNHLNKNDGVVIYIKNNLNARVQEVKLEKSSCLQIDIENMSILGIYRSPSTNNNINTFINSLNNHLESLKNKSNIILTGDININILPHPEEESNDRYNRLKYQNMLAIHGLIAGHCLPTRINNCLDHFMLKIQNNNINCTIAVLNVTSTDHKMIFLCLDKLSKVNRTQKENKITNYDDAIKSLQNRNLQELLRQTNPNDIANTLISEITNALNEHTKIVKVPKNKAIIKPWITSGILRCINNRNKLQKQLNCDPSNYILKTTYKRYRNYCNNLIKKLKRQYESDLLASSTKNNKALWKNIKKITNINNIKSTNTNLLNLKSSNIESVNYINKYFCNIGKKLAEDIDHEKSQTNTQKDTEQSKSKMNSFVLLDTDFDEVSSVLMNLNTNSAPGIDGIPTRFLKLAKNVITPIICHLVNQCFSTGIFPNILKKSVITPVYKGGDRDDLNNYRPISVLTCISKILEKLLNLRLINYLERFKILSPSQFGFRNGKSTEDAVSALTALVVERVDAQSKCLAVFLDLKKAFDTVSVPILLNKLEKIGVRDRPLALIENYLTERKQCVKIENSVSDDENITFGVPQGSVLGPTLFLVYINELCDMKIDHANIFAYADDTAIVFSAKSWEKVRYQTEVGLSKVYKWLQCNKLSLNTTKTNYMCFAKDQRSQPLDSFNIKIHKCCLSLDYCSCTVLEKLCSVKYLGVVMDCRLSWFAHIELVSKRIRRLVWIFKSLRHVANKKLLNQIYVALVQSVVTYCIQVWGGAVKTRFIDLERSQRSLIKVMLFLPYRYPTSQLYTFSNLLSIRKLYVLHTVLRKHRNLPFDSTKLSTRRYYAVARIVACRSMFAQRQFVSQASHLYNHINKILHIYNLKLSDVKKKVQEWLLNLEYADVELLLKYVV